MNETRIIRYIGGETIVAKVIGETKEELVVIKPALVFVQEGPNGSQQVGLAPLAPFCEKEEVKLQKGTMMFHEKANGQMLSNYIKATTNLDIPPTASPGLILG